MCVSASRRNLAGIRLSCAALHRNRKGALLPFRRLSRYRCIQTDGDTFYRTPDCSIFFQTTPSSCNVFCELKLFFSNVIQTLDLINTLHFLIITCIQKYSVWTGPKGCWYTIRERIKENIPMISIHWLLGYGIHEGG